METNASIRSVDPLENPVQTPINNPKNPLPIILGGLVLMVAVVTGVYYLGTQKYRLSLNPQFSNQRSRVATIPTTTLTSQPQPTQPIAPSIPQNKTKAGWRSYNDINYGYKLQYPTDWKLMQEKDSEGANRVRLVGNNALKATFSLRVLPELYITIVNPYSTSGAVCANQFCTETSPPLKIKIKEQNLMIPITKGEVMKDGEKQFDFYAFTFPLPSKRVSLKGYSEPVALNAISSYRTFEEGQIISSILSTLSY